MHSTFLIFYIFYLLQNFTINFDIKYPIIVPINKVIYISGILVTGSGPFGYPNICEKNHSYTYAYP